MFKTFSLLWCYPICIFLDGNKCVDEIKTLTKADAVEYFRKQYPNLDADGYEKYANGSLIMTERIEAF